MIRAVIGIVVPSLNCFSTLDRALSSVLFQAGDFDLLVHVQDGGSSDGTRERLAYWNELVQSEGFPAMGRSVRFTYDIAEDAGPYDAIAKGWSRLSLDEFDWMGWLNADDVLNPGSLQFLSRVDQEFGKQHIAWVTGSASVCAEGVHIADGPRPFSTELVALGLADGVHWDFVQQEGTFFRRWLWDSVDPLRDFVSFRVAGDWNLWRLFAARTDLFQVEWPLGCFSRRPGQLSERLRDVYLGEMASVLPVQARRNNLLSMGPHSFRRRVIRADYETSNLSIVEDSIDEAWARRRALALKPTADLQYSLTRESADVDSGRELKFLAHDSRWQYPAVTEKHAYVQAKRRLGAVRDAVYVGFPWATLIDLLQCDQPVDDLLSALRDLKASCGNTTRVITTCQHILMPRFSYLFKELGVTDVFWSHTSVADVDSLQKFGFRVHPLALYPVSLAKTSGQSSLADWYRRPYLYSFVGTRGDHWYPRRTRDWIFECLASSDESLVLERDGWHFQHTVYQEQIMRVLPAKTDELLAAEDEYRNALGSSRFVLCPSGSGPNTLRFWEALGSGTIPVLLSDDLVLPGDRQAWEDAIVLVPESKDSVMNIPETLKKIEMDSLEIERKLLCCSQLYSEFGPDGFLYSI